MVIGKDHVYRKTLIQESQSLQPIVGFLAVKSMAL
jgi:hypothetical protein